MVRYLISVEDDDVRYWYEAFSEKSRWVVVEILRPSDEAYIYYYEFENVPNRQEFNNASTVQQISAKQLRNNKILAEHVAGFLREVIRKGQRFFV